MVRQLKKKVMAHENMIANLPIITPLLYTPIDRCIRTWRVNSIFGRKIGW